MNAFEQIISQVPEESSVLDVGAGGLHGENTSEALLARFKDYTGICLPKEQQEIDVYQAQRAERKQKPANIIIGDFYDYPFDRQYDFIVNDLTIEKNLTEWSENWERTVRHLKPGGYLATFIMTTDNYGDPLYTPHLIRKHRLEFWGAIDQEEWRECIDKKLRSLENFELILSVQEERRPYIQWVLLKQK